MHVLSLEIQNVKGIKAARIEPNGNLVVVSGKNGAGKTSALDALWLAIQGSAAAKESPSPVRHGEKHARVEVDLGDLLVIRTWNPSTGRTGKLEVRDAEGVAQRSPQKLLDSLAGKLAFDPLTFSRMPAKEQRAELLKVVELPFDPDELDQQRAKVFAQRTEVNRDIKKLQAQLDACPEPPKDLPDEEVSLAELQKEHEYAFKGQRRARELREALGRAGQNAERAKRALEAAQAEWERAQADVVLAQEKVDKIPAELPDPEAALRRLASAEGINRAVREEKRRQDIAAQLAGAKEVSDDLTEQLDQIDHEKASGLKAAKMPVEGLSFDEDGVTFNGVPLQQCSGAERLKVSTAVAMALNPTMRFCRIEDGPLLDQDSMEELREMAEEHAFQIWLERIEGGPTSVVIEDGEVAHG